MAMNILFAFFPTHIPYSLGIAQLSSLCKQRGIKTHLSILSTMQDFKDKLDASAYDYVCFSVITHLDAPRILPFIEYAGVSGQNVLVGGTWAKWFQSPFLTCRGDGETLPDYLLNGDDRLFREEMVCEDLNALPLPDFEMFKDHPFDRGYGLLDAVQIPYYSSRGCPHACSFCLNVLQSGGYRVRTRVEEDLREITGRYGPDMVFIGDAMLPYSSESWKKSWGEFRFPFFGYIRADISREDLLWLIDRGMVQTAFGVESGDEEYRNTVLNKGLTDAQLFQTVSILKKHDVGFVPFYMTGTPGETFEIRAKTWSLKNSLGGFPFLTDYQELV